LVVYSDGLSEALDDADREFGRDRLAEVCRRHRARPAGELASEVEAATDAFVGGTPYGDDRTIVVVRRLPPG
jgi:sigma-B regulation protein RsbU (phosphoserine phosphatase)